jgi:hypothetical protein
MSPGECVNNTELALETLCILFRIDFDILGQTTVPKILSNLLSVRGCPYFVHQLSVKVSFSDKNAPFLGYIIPEYADGLLQQD